MMSNFQNQPTMAVTVAALMIQIQLRSMFLIPLSFLSPIYIVKIHLVLILIINMNLFIYYTNSVLNFNMVNISAGSEITKIPGLVFYQFLLVIVDLLMTMFSTYSEII